MKRCEENIIFCIDSRNDYSSTSVHASFKTHLEYIWMKKLMHLPFPRIFLLRTPKCFQLRTTVGIHFLCGKSFWDRQGYGTETMTRLYTRFFVNLLKYNPIMFSIRIHSLKVKTLEVCKPLMYHHGYNYKS